MKNPARFALVFLSVVASTFAWDVPGHIMVAKIAYDHTSANARKQMDALAPLLTFDVLQSGKPPIHHTFNGVNFAGWPDIVKHADPAQTPFAGHFGDWHFVDLGLSPNDPNPLTNPPPLGAKTGDAIEGLKLVLDVLGHRTTSPLVPSDEVALALLVHLVGDLHQPLHCATHYLASGKTDAGGNGVAVTNFKNEYAELHQLWDVGYKLSFDAKTKICEAGPDLVTFATTPTSPDLVAAVKTLSKNQSPVTIDLTGDYLVNWVQETHQLAVTVAYGKLGSNLNSTSIAISGNYEAAVKKTTQRQIYVAGLRLAAIFAKLYP